MARAFYVVIGVILLQMYAHGKENDTIETTESKVLSPTLTDKYNKKITNINDEISKNVENSGINNNQDDQGEQGQRQKRGYNFNGFPQIPPIYPTYPSRYDLSFDNAYSQEDAFIQIYKKLNDIAATVRQPTTPPIPPATRYPIFFPFFYLPTNNCGCTAGEHKTPHQPNPKPTKPTPTKPKPSKPIETLPTNTTLPSKNITVPSRGPEILENVNPSFIESEEDFSRPISFDPIPPNDDIKRRPPPVEHGSVQGDITSVNSARSTTIQPLPNIDSSINIPRSPNPDTPNICDRAIISCCHQVTVTYNCFVTQGCPEPSLYGNPCDTITILKVIERLQKFYGPRAG